MQDLKVILQEKKPQHSELCSNYIVVKVVVKSVLKDYRSPLNSSKQRQKQIRKKSQEQSIPVVG